MTQHSTPNLISTGGIDTTQKPQDIIYKGCGILFLLFALFITNYIKLKLIYIYIVNYFYNINFPYIKK
jgi:hypothetical protein